MRTSAPPLLAVFRSRLQGDLLAQVLLNPVECTVTEIAAVLEAPLATVHREAVRLEEAGLLTSRRVGRARLLLPDDTNPAVSPLRELVLIAFGPRQVVAEEFGGLAGAGPVLIHGSWAARYEGEVGPPPGDVDVLVVGTPSRDEVFDAAERAGRRLRRPVNTTVVARARWDAADEPFLQEVRRRPHLLVV